MSKRLMSVNGPNLNLLGEQEPVICGAGAYGYILAMQAAARLVGELSEALPGPIRIGPR